MRIAFLRGRRGLVFSLALALSFAGCSPLGTPSTAQHQILEKPDAAFFKRVKSDPFPTASQGLSSAAGATTSTTNAPGS